jgi:hypothetical protein
VDKTNINHPPVITIFTGAIFTIHSNPFLLGGYHGIVSPTWSMLVQFHFLGVSRQQGEFIAAHGLNAAPPLDLRDAQWVAWHCWGEVMRS